MSAISLGMRIGIAWQVADDDISVDLLSASTRYSIRHVSGCKSCEFRAHAVTRRSAVGFAVMTAVFLPWCLTFMIGEIRMLTDNIDHMLDIMIISSGTLSSMFAPDTCD